MRITVRTLTGRQIEIHIEPNDRVQRLKERVEEILGPPPEQQRLILSGEQMDSERTVSDYNLQEGSAIHLVLALRS